MDNACLNKWCDCGNLAEIKYGARRVCRLCLIGLRQQAAKAKRRVKKVRK